MNSRITAILISLLSVTGVFATTVIEQNDSITNEIVSDSITMAMPSDSITIQVTDTDSIARQQEADKNLLSLLETDSRYRYGISGRRRLLGGGSRICRQHKSYARVGRNTCQPTFLTYRVRKTDVYSFSTFTLGRKMPIQTKVSFGGR